jgi:hypothetical protein
MPAGKPTFAVGRSTSAANAQLDAEKRGFSAPVTDHRFVQFASAWLILADCFA